MGFKTTLDIGCFNWDRRPGAFITRPLDAATVESAIVRSGGYLFAVGHPTSPQLTAIARAMVSYGAEDALTKVGRMSLGSWAASRWCCIRAGTPAWRWMSAPHGRWRIFCGC
jgi:hypothetical protein